MKIFEEPKIEIVEFETENIMNESLNEDDLGEWN